MNNMTNQVKEIKTTVEEFKMLCMVELAEQGAFEEAPERGIKALQTATKLLNQSIELMETEAKMLETMDGKLDKLLARKN